MENNIEKIETMLDKLYHECRGALTGIDSNILTENIIREKNMLLEQEILRLEVMKNNLNEQKAIQSRIEAEKDTTIDQLKKTVESVTRERNELSTMKNHIQKQNETLLNEKKKMLVNLKETEILLAAHIKRINKIKALMPQFIRSDHFVLAQIKKRMGINLKGYIHKN